jgi:hypothetical protein
VTVEEAQREVRSIFMGGLVSQLVSGVLWSQIHLGGGGGGFRLTPMEA